ncbi:hypothetical protein HYH03_001864 [Edaphochlamys debaryana]|uniref:Uncharacterized protein n=1 Tax=Edaphochlamys debaryana TaxID=47281 RepID=A0A835YG33_9CHLO|nr:hypothetical protein HYH03_001864 [Edaphochlamys debaryana]|eukprot:KAG2500286.1 hypothetical protein HYH03_001864 [Edaphochlamys debaryana]
MLSRALDQLRGVVPLPPTRFVSLVGNAFNHQDWQDLVEALRSNREAVGLRCQAAGLTDSHARLLAEALAVNPLVEVLELPDNAIGSTGVQALVEALRLSNTTLKSVDLSGNPCMTDAQPALQELDTLLRRNRVIRKLPKTPPRTPGGSDGGDAPVPASASAGPRSQQQAASGARALSGSAFEVERRLQHLEEAEATIRSELEHARSFTTQYETWGKKIETAGQQIASILALVDSRNLALETRLSAMERWRANAEHAWAEQAKVVEQLALDLRALQQRMHLLEAQASKAHGAEADGLEAQRKAQAEAAEAAAAAAVLRSEMQALGERLERLEREQAASGAALRAASLQKASSGRRDAATAVSTAGPLGAVDASPRSDQGPGHSAADEPAAGPLCADPSEITFACPEPMELSPSATASPVSELNREALVGPGRLDSAGLSGSLFGSSPFGECTDKPAGTAHDVSTTATRRSFGVLPIEVPSNGIVWHTNALISPSSCGNTPTPTAATNRFSHGRSGTASGTTAAAQADGRGAPSEAERSLEADDCAPLMASAAANAFAAAAGTALAQLVLYPACQRGSEGGATGASPSLRYGLQPHDSMDSTGEPTPRASLALPAEPCPASHRPTTVTAPAHCSPATTASRRSSPNTPPDSTFSVDPERVSLSAAMAGSAARPRAPAAAATTETSPLPPASHTEDPGEAARLAETNEPPEMQRQGSDGSMHSSGGFDAAFHTPSRSLAGACRTQAACASAQRPAASDPFLTPGISVAQWGDPASRLIPSTTAAGPRAQPGYANSPLSRLGSMPKRAPVAAQASADGAEGQRTPARPMSLGRAGVFAKQASAKRDQEEADTMRDSDSGPDQGHPMAHAPSPASAVAVAAPGKVHDVPEHAQPPVGPEASWDRGHKLVGCGSHQPARATAPGVPDGRKQHVPAPARAAAKGPGPGPLLRGSQARSGSQGAGHQHAPAVGSSRLPSHGPAATNAPASGLTADDSAARLAAADAHVLAGQGGAVHGRTLVGAKAPLRQVAGAGAKTGKRWM